jgi:hypothetical protein
MTKNIAADELVVTQADRDAAAWALDKCPNTMTWENLTASHRTPEQIWGANRAAKAFARHRQQAEAALQAQVDELVEGLREAVLELEYVDRRFPTGTTPALLTYARVLLAKHT